MDQQHPAITAYEKAINGIPDCFDCLSVDSIRDYTNLHTNGLQHRTASDMAGSFIAEHFEYLAEWYDAIDELDSELRCHVVAGGLPDDQALYLQLQALALFTATTALQRAVCEYHHGTAGPGLSEAYGHAYALSNSALSPFAAVQGA